MELIDSDHLTEIIKESHVKGFSDLNFSYSDLYNIPFFLLERPILLSSENESYITLELSHLKFLNLSSNHIKKINPKVSTFSSLEILNLSNNKIEHLPRQITELRKLRVLILSNNPLVKVPEKIASMQSLEHLDISNTGVYDLPSNFKFLSNLKSLDLSNCAITFLPKEIIELPSLERIELAGNPLIDPPIEIAVKGLDALKKYFEELGTADEKDFLYEVKLLLVGEERVGKSSLTKALSDENYSFDLYEKSTEGIDIKKWLIQKAKLNHGKDFQINIWDFGGQEIYHATHQFFLTKRSIYFLVTEARKDLRHDDLFYWLNLIEVLGGKSPVVIVVNKSDQPYTFFASDSYKERFPNLLQVENVSCVPGHSDSIDRLKLTVYSILKDKNLMPDIGIELPKAWVNIRRDLDILRDEGTNFIDTARYFKICEKYSLNKERALFLSDYLHDLGVILHFRQDFLLKDTIFLNFEWVTKAVYCILDNPKVISQKGEFTSEDLESIWKDNGFTSKKNELLALMKNDKFDICFEIVANRYLAPQLLHPDKIKTNWPASEDSIRFEYWYEFMPKGIISRFIVKCHQYIFDDVYWKHGALFQYNDTKALVEEKYFESPKKISIEVTGGAKKEILAIFRGVLEDINTSFNKLVVREMIKCCCKTCRNHVTPTFFDLGELSDRLKNSRYFIECRLPPYERISISDMVNHILSDIEFPNLSTVPLGMEDFELKKTTEKLEKSNERLTSLKKLNAEISSAKVELQEMESQKNELDAEAIEKAKRIGWLYVLLNISVVSIWLFFIFHFGWDIMEKWTFISGLVLAVCNSIFFIARQYTFNQSDIWKRKLNSIRDSLYKKNRFSLDKYAKTKKQLEKLEEEYQHKLNQ
ncbi:MAG: COR domain-containing protein [Imperialibacter sp.]|uniref:COR domain-containing protein n=1 Tax=Imperialibacter sp. TaxID=2038411 RepID=UPI003A86790D